MRYFFIFLLVFFSVLIFGQNMVIDWDKCLGGSTSSSYSDHIDVLPNRNIVGSIYAYQNHSAFTNYHGGGDPWVFMLDSHGILIKERCFGGTEYESFIDSEVFDEYIYFIGYTQSTDGDVQSEPIGGYADLWVVKTDFDLNIIWERRYGSLGIQELHKAKVTENGGLVLLMDFFDQGGGDVSEYYGNTDIWVCEIDADGEILWEKTLGNAYGTFAGSVMQTQDGKTIVLGEMDISGGMVECEGHNNDGSRDIWIVGLDETGEILWQNCLGGSHWEIGSDIIQEGGGYTFLGTTLSGDGDVEGYHWAEWSGDAWLVHVDNIGNLVWQKCLGGYDVDAGGSLYKTETGGYLIFANTDSNDGDVNHSNCPDNHPHCQTNTWVVELDADRNIIWNKTYGSAQNSSSNAAVARINERDFIIADLIEEYDTHSGDVSCTPYPINSGKSAWIYRLYDPDTGGLSNFSTSGLKTYPNPANDQMFFDLPKHKDNITIEIQNIFGNTIKQLSAISNQIQIQWNCQNTASGVYFYHTEISGIIYRGRIVIQ